MSPFDIIARGAAAAVLLAALPARAGEPPSREELLCLVNAERRAQGVAPLRLSPALARVAQAMADEAAAGEDSEEPGLLDRVNDAGYEARLVSQVLARVKGDAQFLISSWRDRGGRTYTDLLRADHRDVGIGVARNGDAAVVVFLLGLSFPDFFAQKTRELQDRERIRAEMLGRVNLERRRARLSPLRGNPVLHRAAGRYAEEMLARGFYGHTSPEGKTAWERTREAGYRAETVAENLARGQYSVGEVMDGWMGSEVHRRNILSRQFLDAGFGLAVGRGAGGLQVIWVQIFGRPRP